MLCLVPEGGTQPRFVRRHKGQGVYIMKIMIGILTLMTFSPAQSQVSDTTLQYYPLQIGNTWEYCTSANPASPTTYHQISVVGDSIAPNRLHYFVLRQIDFVDNGTSISLVRVDSATACVYQCANSAANGETMIDSLHSRRGDTFGMFTLELISQESILGISTTVESLQALVEGHQLAYGLGKCSEWQMGSPYDENSTLVYAKIGGKEYGTFTKVKKQAITAQGFSLSQNFPNPFNPSTLISFSLPQSGLATLEIHNVLGQKMQTVVEGILPAGTHQNLIDGTGWPSGIYYYTLRTRVGSITKTMMLLK